MNESIERLESGVRGYVRSFPTVFTRAQNARLENESGQSYIDFFAGAGTLSYGHNNPVVKKALIAHIERDGLMHGLDMATDAKLAFLEIFERVVLKPRSLDYKIQFTGPTGTNAVEAAIKLARKVKKRSHVISFTNGYHGHSLGALALTGNSYYHDEHYGARNNVTHWPFDGYFGDTTDTAAQLRQVLSDSSSGIPIPAAIILEPIQAEGGINVASDSWLREIRRICDDFDIALIIDDIQVGNGRSGHYFSFESSGIVPDMICLSKAIGGGLPLSLVLIKPELDVWQAGEHTGTFRGNQLAFVAASALLPLWGDDTFLAQYSRNCANAHAELARIASKYPGVELRGKGMIWGLAFANGALAGTITKRCFESGLVIETAGADDQVVKFLAPFTTEDDTLAQGLSILSNAVDDVMANVSTVKLAH